MTMPVIMDGGKPIPQERVDEICSHLSALSFAHISHSFNQVLCAGAAPSNLSYFKMLIDDPCMTIPHQVKFGLQDKCLVDVYGEIPRDIRAVYLATKDESSSIWAKRGAEHMSRSLALLDTEREKGLPFFTVTEFCKEMKAWQEEIEEKYPSNELVLLERHKATTRPDPAQPSKAQWGTKALRVMRFPGLGT